MVKRYENLFICITLLKLKIVTKIIEKKGLNKQNCCCFYYSNQNTLANKYYLSKLKKRCSKILNFRNIYSFPKYFFLLKKIFKNFNVKNVYVTNIDGIYVQFILSIINPKIFIPLMMVQVICTKILIIILVMILEYLNLLFIDYSEINIQLHILKKNQKNTFQFLKIIKTTPLKIFNI